MAEGQEELILVCGMGGGIDPEPRSFTQRGQQSRSLIAAFEVMESVGGLKVRVLKGGFRGFIRGGRRTSASL